jgi:hypothetical protein
VLLAVPLTSTSSSLPPPKCFMCAFKDSDAESAVAGVVVLRLYVSPPLIVQHMRIFSLTGSCWTV